jgi:hypothetical protein
MRKSSLVAIFPWL